MLISVDVVFDRNEQRVKHLPKISCEMDLRNSSWEREKSALGIGKRVEVKESWAQLIPIGEFPIGPKEKCRNERRV
ncbi:hypothetical protein CEXT_787571 [Caerostris extrusa]|uniref:Uncharacterized protein n=1 Tax=Caerostris extrusa TaxID=172846 RepID=A0AAV4SHH9_CAEEX|nr:hypothetical protein CEXT_787571 [Caerostris extrusa]